MITGWIIFICILPSILYMFGINLGYTGNLNGLQEIQTYISNHPGDIHTEYTKWEFIHTTLELIAFCTAIFTAILALIYFRITKNIFIPVISIVLLFSGFLDIFHILVAEKIIAGVVDNQIFLPLTWTIGRLISAMIMGIGFLIMSSFSHKIKSLKLVIIASVFFGFLAYLIIHFSAASPYLSKMIFTDLFISRPFDIAPIIVYLIVGGFVYRYNSHNIPSYFSTAILVSIIPYVIAQIHMAFGSTQLYDAHHNIAHFLKIIAYLIPLFGLLTDYVYASEHEKTQTKKAEEARGLIKESQNIFSHEFRTPLTIILGNVPLLSDPNDMPEPEEINEIARDIESSGRHLLNIIDDLLDIAKIEAGEMRFFPQFISTQILIQNILSELKVITDDKKLEIESNVENIRMYADPTHLKQILYNLLSNAIKFTEKGKITVNVYQEEDMVFFEILDSGRGIPKIDQELIFEKFRQVDSSSTRQVEGTGLGLVITKKLVELHGGKISLESELDKGSKFRFMIPTEFQENEIS
jgi:signal transduction histidine kinase